MTRDEIEARVRRVVSSTFGIDDALVVPTATIRGTLQLDSMEVVQLIEEIEHEFGMKRGENSLDAYQKINDIGGLVSFIEQAAKKKG